MPQPDRKRIDVFLAINEIGQYYVSQVGAQDALDKLRSCFGGIAFRVIDVEMDVLLADPSAARRYQKSDPRTS